MNVRKFVKEKIDSTEKSGAINMCVKPISMIISLIYVPILLSYLGDEKYGLWATLLSIINWVNYFDVGIGNGLRNLLSKEMSEDNFDEARKSVSTAYVVLTIIAGVVFCILLVSVFAFNWESLLSTKLTIRPVLIISFAFICINFILALSNIFLYALQKSEYVAIRGCVVQAINLIGVVVLRQTTEGSLVAMSILFGASTMMVYLMNTASIMKKRPYLRPSYKWYEKCKVKEICNIGIKFFLVQIFCILLFTVDNLLITHYFGAAEVTPFSIANKVFNTAYTVFATFLVPYWSRSTIAFARKDYKWIESALKKVCLICGVFIICYFVILLIFKPLVFLWMGRELEFQNGLILVMCLFYSLYSIVGVECQFINGSGKINTQLIMYAIIGFANIPLSIYMGVTLKMGSLGIRLATTILVFLEIIVLGVNLHSIISKLKKESIKLNKKEI